jgi:phosphoribosylamine--glycine ligase
MRVLVIGSGGREHTICYFLSKASNVEELYCIPANAGIAEIAKIPQDLKLVNSDELLKFIKSKNIELVVIGPEAPLVEGLVDFLSENNIKAFGPTKDVALLEGSKIYAKKFMREYNIPTPNFRDFYVKKEALSFLNKVDKFPVVIKADGLAQGKGSIICKDYNQARECIEDMMTRKIFNKAGEKILIEDYEIGKEVSIFIFCDGKDYKLMPPTYDYKRVYDNDQGLNTGGMGAISSWNLLEETTLNLIKENIIERTLWGISQQNKEYKGVLYFGLILTQQGPKVLEYNVRFGDPEAQVILPLLKAPDLLEIINCCINGNLKDCQIEWDKEAFSLCVVLASSGYPKAYKKGIPIYGLDKVPRDIFIFHAGTAFAKNNNHKIVTNGGRVLNVVGKATNIKELRKKVYSACELIKFEGMHYRRDIGRILSST